MADLARLVVKLEAQSAQLTAELGRAKAQLRRFDTDVSEIAGKIGRGIGLATAAAAAGLAAMVKSNLDAADELGKMSQKIGIATDELSKLVYAAKLADVESEQLKKALVALNEAANDAADGTGAAAAAFKALGIDINSIKDPKERFLALADAVSKFADGAGKTSAVVAILGQRLGPDLVPLLNEGAKGFRAAGDELQRFGGVVTPQASAQADIFNDNLDKMKTAAMGLANQIITPLIPAINDLTTAMLEQVDNTKNVETAYSKIIPVFKELVLWGANFEAGLEKIRSTALRTALALSFPTLSNIKLQLEQANEEWDSADEKVRRVERSLQGLGGEAQRAGMRLEDALDPLGTAGQIPFRTGPDLLLRPDAGSSQKPQLDFNAEAMEAARKAAEDSAKKRASVADAARKESDNALESIQRMIQGLQTQAETYGMTSSQVMQYRITQGDLAETFAKAGKGANQYKGDLVALTEEIEKQQKAVEKLNADLAVEEKQRGAQKSLEGMVAEMQQANVEMNNGAESVMRYRLSQGDLSQLLADAGPKAAELRDELIRLAAANEEAANRTEDAWTVFADQAARNAQDAFAEFLFDPFKGGLEGMYLGFAATLRRMAAEAAAAQIFESLGLGGNMTGGKVSGGMPGWLQIGTQLASTYFSGGFGGTKPISSGTMPAPTMTGTAPVVETFNMPARADGGPVTAGIPYIVGERGKELFVPKTSGAIIPNHVVPNVRLPAANDTPAPRMVNQTINISTPDANSFRASERQIGRRARRILT